MILSYNSLQDHAIAEKVYLREDRAGVGLDIRCSVAPVIVADSNVNLKIVVSIIHP